MPTRLRRGSVATAIGGLGAMLLGMVLLGGCTSPEPPRICVPELSVSPAVVAPGATVTVTTERACPLEDPEADLIVRAQPEDSPTPAAEVTTKGDRKGGFSVEIMIPWEMPAGPAIASIANWWDVAECPDNASCAQAAGTFAVEPDIARCLPYDLEASPTDAERGDTLTVVAPSQGCQGTLVLEALSTTVYRVVLFDSARTPVASVDAPLRAGGSLRTTLTVPDDMPLGGAWVGVTNYFDIAPCPPTADCVGPTALITIVG